MSCTLPVTIWEEGARRDERSEWGGCATTNEGRGRVRGVGVWRVVEEGKCYGDKLVNHWIPHDSGRTGEDEGGKARVVGNEG